MDEQRKPASRIKNEQIVAELVDKLGQAKTVVLADQSGLTVSQSADLKKKLRNVDAEMLVAKNTLIKIATKQTGHQVPDEALNGPTAALFAYGDEVTPLKELTTFAKENEKPIVKAGFLGTMFLTPERISQLAKLPNKETLRGQVVGGLYTPLYGLVSVLNGNIRNLVYALNAIRESKS